MMKCDIPPKGWRCTREPGHEGPCAAVPDGETRVYPMVPDYGGLTSDDVDLVLRCWNARKVPTSTSGARVEAANEKDIAAKLAALQLLIKSQEG